MPKVTFDQLIDIYNHTVFDNETGRDGTLTIASQEILSTLTQIDDDEAATMDSGIAIGDAVRNLGVGDIVRIEVGSPRLGLGLLVDTFDDLLRAPGARLKEPARYYIKRDRVTNATRPATENQVRYRQILEIIGLMSMAASYVDETKEELVFLNDRKVVLPVSFSAVDLQRVDIAVTTRLKELFNDEIHKDQKLAILSSSIVKIVEAESRPSRLSFLLSELQSVADDVAHGYRLFASSFSYSKIKNELESAKIEFVTKIHRTIVDIQGQLLGIPVATIVVASQLKAAQQCDGQFWANVAITFGAWVFIALLLIALLNQWATLNAISREIARQRDKLKRDYAAIGDDLDRVFKDLPSRVCWHRAGLILVGAISLLGAAIATAAFIGVTGPSIRQCLAVL